MTPATNPYMKKVIRPSKDTFWFDHNGSMINFANAIPKAGARINAIPISTIFIVIPPYESPYQETYDESAQSLC